MFVKDVLAQKTSKFQISLYFALFQVHDLQKTNVCSNSKGLQDIFL